MKWSLYKIYLFYNMIVCAAITCYGLYKDLERDSFDFIGVLIFTGLVSGFLKNGLSWRIMIAHSRNEVISKRMAIPFYVLWVINIIYTIALYFVAWQILSETTLNRNEMLVNMIVLAFIAMSFTSTYTLVLDIPLVKKASGEADHSEELLSDYNKEAV